MRLKSKRLQNYKFSIEDLRSLRARRNPNRTNTICSVKINRTVFVNESLPCKTRWNDFSYLGKGRANREIFLLKICLQE